MTKRKPTKRCHASLPQGPFHYEPGSDGCDDTFDVIDGATGAVLCRARYWDDCVGAENDAKLMVAMLTHLRTRTDEAFSEHLVTHRNAADIDGKPPW